MERDANIVAEDMLWQYRRNPEGLIVQKPVRFFYTEHDPATAKYSKSGAWGKLVDDRFKVLLNEYLTAKHARL